MNDHNTNLKVRMLARQQYALSDCRGTYPSPGVMNEGPQTRLFLTQEAEREQEQHCPLRTVYVPYGPNGF